MIIVRLEGGLGNQMFQYALGRRLSIINNTKLKFDLSVFDKTRFNANATWREYLLAIFRIKLEIAGEDEIQKVKTYSPSLFDKAKYKLLGKPNPYGKTEVYESKLFKFDSLVLKTPFNSYITGYWQSPYYFDAIRKVLLNDFQFKEIPNVKNYSFINEISNQNSVSVHIRRGDYASNPKHLKNHGLCSPEYYHNAIEFICNKVENPAFYFFSDEINWVEENIKINYPAIYIKATSAEKDFYDLYMMSLCKHNIIANSSFSWWRAWLNKNPDKIVIAPKKWMAGDSIDTTDLIPGNWIRL